MALLTEERPWPRNGRTRRAGVSSFGISGTNAHVIIEESPPHEQMSAPLPAGQPAPSHGLGLVTAGAGPATTAPAPPAPPRASLLPWILSGRGAEGLQAQARRLGELLAESPELDPADVALALAGRPRLEQRAVLLGDREQLLRSLGALARGEAEEAAAPIVTGSAATAAGPAAASTGGAVFLFPGQGGQWEGMAVELLTHSPLFARRLAECADALEPFVGWRLEEVLRGAPGAAGLAGVDVVQPALWAVMVSLAELWRACGVRPCRRRRPLAGRDRGGVRGRRSDAGGWRTGRGAAQSSFGCARRPWRDGVGRARAGCRSSRCSRASTGGPASRPSTAPARWCSRERSAALEQLVAQCEADGVRARMIAVDYAAHSAQVEAIRDQLVEGCAAIVPREGEIPFHSTVTAGPLSTAELDGEYWYRNLRETVRFDEVTRALLAAGRRLFVEVGPHPVLAVGLQETGATIIGSLRRDDGGPLRFLTSLAQAWVHGAEVEWRALLERPGAHPVALPPYTFQRERYWLRTGAGAGDVGAAGLGAAGHPLLGAAIALADGASHVLTGRLSLDAQPWLADHAALGTALLPGTAFVELALHAGAQLGSGGAARADAAGAADAGGGAGGADPGGSRRAGRERLPERGHLLAPGGRAHEHRRDLGRRGVGAQRRG